MLKNMPIDYKITFIYVLCVEFLQSLNFKDKPHTKMSRAEVMTTAIVAIFLFSGNFKKSSDFLQTHGYIKNMLSASRFNRRLHSISETTWQALFDLLASIAKSTNNENEYIIDSFPIPVCDNIRIKRSKIYQGEDYRGYMPSKRRYFYGLRAHVIVTKNGQPVELILEPGEIVDVTTLKKFEFNLPQNAKVYGDKGYNDYEFEDLLREILNIHLIPIRKKNSKRQYDPWIPFMIQPIRKKIETTFSEITSLFPKKIHAVTSKGFEIKCFLFILTFAILAL